MASLLLHICSNDFFSVSYGESVLLSISCFRNVQPCPGTIIMCQSIINNLAKNYVVYKYLVNSLELIQIRTDLYSEPMLPRFGS
jgi:hypothetical protein